MEEFLRQHGIVFTVRDVTTDPDAYADLERLGVMTTPVSFVNGRAVVGYDLATLRKLLEISD